MLGLDYAEIATSTVRFWVAAGSAALLVLVCVLAFVRTRKAAIEGGTGSAIVMMVIGAAALGAASAWAVLDIRPFGDQRAERRALEMRAQELTLRTLAPGSPLACLDALTGDNVEAACERALFATPATVATATTFVVARLALLADMTSNAGTDGADNATLPLRRALEADRFGLLAHALAVRDGCTSEHCAALAVLQDSDRVRANMREDAFDRYLERYVAMWALVPEVPVAEASQAQPGAVGSFGAQGSRKVSVNIDFPSAASIPPVSIMNPEPKAPGAAAAARSKPEPGGATSPRGPRKQTANAPGQGGAASSTAEPVDPVWMPAVPAAAAQANAGEASAATNSAANPSAPVQLNPFPPPPAGAPGTTVRAQ
jgi:hypothetical protein